MISDPFQNFRQIVDRPNEQIDLGRAALAIALDDYPALEIPTYLARLNELAAAVTRHIGPQADVYRKILGLNTVLFGQERFRANRAEYFDPKNSFLNEVLDRKTGIPITLSVLYMEVAQRVELPLAGVSFPGHFLVKYDSGDDEIILDPFNEGEMKTTANLKKMIDEQYSGKVKFQRDFLEASTKKQILKRMLNNLKVIYLRDDALMKALPVIERMVILDPAGADDIRDRGMVYLKLECFKQAREDFERYLALEPDAPDARRIRDTVIDLTKQSGSIH